MYGHSVDWGSSSPCIGQALWYHLPSHQMEPGCKSRASGHCSPDYLYVYKYTSRASNCEIPTLVDEPDHALSPLSHAKCGTRDFTVVSYKPCLAQVGIYLHIDRLDLNLVVLNAVDGTNHILAWSNIEKHAQVTNCFGLISLPNWRGAVKRGYTGDNHWSPPPWARALPAHSRAARPV